MITENEIYWITRMDYFHGLSLAVGIVLTVLSVLFLIGAAIAWFEDDDKKSLLIGGAVFMFCLTLIIGSCFIPTTKEMCAIKVIPAIANNEEVQEIPNKIVELAGEWIEELKPKKD